MFHFLSFSFLLFVSFLLEQSFFVPLGVSPGGFFVSFFVFFAGLFFLEREQGWWFALYGGILGGIFSVMPFFSFLFFVGTGAVFLFIKPLLPLERAFSFLAALWFGAVIYLLAQALFWGIGRIFGMPDIVAVSMFAPFFWSVALFASGVLLPFSFIWWLLVYRRRNKQSYMLR